MVSADTFFTPDEKPTRTSFVLGLAILGVAVVGLTLELSKPESKLGWGLRSSYNIIIPPRYAVDPVIEQLKRLRIDESDIDIMVRTVIGEAAREPDEGKIAVAWVILTRAMHNTTWYGGNSVTRVSLHQSTRQRNGKTVTTWQFEPWMSRRLYLWTISKNSELYKHVRSLVVGCINGTHADPTDGATHFLEPTIVKKRTGGTLPIWAQGNGKRIGNHVFFKHGKQGPDQ